MPSLTRLLPGRAQHYAQYLPPWSGPLWMCAAALCTINHIYCSTLHNQGIIHTVPSSAAATQRILSLLIEFFLMISNTSVIFHVSRMLASRKTRQNNSIFAYLCPIITLLILTAINIVLTAIPLVAPSALVTVTAYPSYHTKSTELPPTLYNYSPSLLVVGYGVPLSLVLLSILAGAVLIWGYGQNTSSADGEPVSRSDLYNMSWQAPGVRLQV